MSRTLLLLALLLGLAAGSCDDTMPSEGNPPDTVSIAGTTWRLESITSDGRVERIDTATNIRLRFDAATFTGNGPCNRYGGSYTTDGVLISFSNFTSTEIACAQLALEDTYFDALVGVASYAATSTDLKLYARGGSIVLDYAPAAHEPIDTTPRNVEFRNRRWALVAIESGGAIDSVRGEPRVTIAFDSSSEDSGELVGMGPCNLYDARYHFDSASIRIEDLTSGGVECERSALEARYFEALEAARSYRSSATSLRIQYAGGVLHYAPHDGPVNPPPGPLPPGDWRLRAIVTGTRAEPVFTVEGITIGFTDGGAFTGIGACNRYNGTFRREGAMITDVRLSEGGENCPERPIEERYFSLLRKARRIHLTQDSTLRIVCEGGFSLLYTRRTRLDVEPGLDSTSWRLRHMTQRGGAPMAPNGMIKLSFSERRLEGQSICNTYGAQYRTNGPLLNVRDWTNTEKACREAQYEEMYFGALQQALDFEIEGRTLIIHSPTMTLFFDRL